MDRPVENTFYKGIDHSFFLAEFEAYNMEALVICKIQGGMNPTMIAYRNGDAGMKELPNGDNFPFISKAKEIRDSLQPDAIITIFEFLKHAPGTIFGQIQPVKEDVMILSVRSRDGIIKEDRMYSYIRDGNGHIVGFKRKPGQHIYFPEWGEK